MSWRNTPRVCGRGTALCSDRADPVPPQRCRPIACRVKAQGRRHAGPIGRARPPASESAPRTAVVGEHRDGLACGGGGRVARAVGATHIEGREVGEHGEHQQVVGAGRAANRSDSQTMAGGRPEFSPVMWSRDNGENGADAFGAPGLGSRARAWPMGTISSRDAWYWDTGTVGAGRVIRLFSAYTEATSARASNC